MKHRLLSFYKSLRHGLTLAASLMVVGVMSGCTAYQAYDQSFDRELQLEASADGGTVRYVIKNRREGNLSAVTDQGQGFQPARRYSGKAVVSPERAKQAFPNLIETLDVLDYNSKLRAKSSWQQQLAEARTR